MIGAVLQVVPVRIPGLEAGAIPGAQDLLTALGDEDDLALEDPYEFVLGRMPVAL